MKIFGEELGVTGRYYVLLPPLLLIGFLIGLFFLAGASQTKLNAASQRVHDSLLRQQALTEYVALVTDAESAQRGYLLTGETAYLNPYRDSASKIPPISSPISGLVSDSLNARSRSTPQTVRSPRAVLSLTKYDIGSCGSWR